VLLIRHARQDLVAPGFGNDPPLLPEGLHQAHILAQRLKALKLAAVYASTLRRAIDTAAPLAAASAVPVCQLAGLDEVDIGSWADGEFRRRAATDDPAMLEFKRSGRWDSLPVGEGDSSLRNRTTGAVLEIAAAHRGATVAMVSHSGAINAVLAQAVGATRTVLAALDHTSVTTLQCAEDGVTVLAVNDVRHLSDPLLRLGSR
jgi:2,3-bisphosphoglycerate-dependent phosphoglycerate mutase